MNTFIYEATHKNNFVCYPIITEKTLDKLVIELHNSAMKFVSDEYDKGNYADIFYPFEDSNLMYKKYNVLVSPCMDKSIANYLIPIEKWEKAHI
jgi:hypothetical protein